MAASRAVSASQRLCSKYRRYFYVASCILAVQVFLAFSFYSMNQKDPENSSRTKYEPIWDLESADVGSRALADNFDRSGKQVDSNRFNVGNTQHVDSGHPSNDNEAGHTAQVYKPQCNISNPEAVSAITRAKTVQCRQEISDVVCLAQNGQLYPESLPRYCPLKGNDTGTYKGCYKDNYKNRDLTGTHVDFPLDNAPHKCINYCLQAGFKYAGVQYGRECWCGDGYGSHGTLPDKKCDSICPHDRQEKCGGHLAVRIFSTGLGEKIKHGSQFVTGGVNHAAGSVRIAYILTVNGRALRQILRLFKAIFHANHYFYIHVDVRQEYLYRELSLLMEKYPNVRLAKTRFATIWGGASLLKMLLQCMEDLMAIKEWKWDYFVNLSESDFPIQKEADLVAFLTKYKTYNFLRSHGKDTPRFIRKQGLDKTFYECDNHMWRIGSRTLPTGIRVDGGSDWIGLHRNFCRYLTTTKDELVTQLKHIYQFALLPAESFFHTVLQNSAFCGSVIDNNLHLTNWRRKQGCKCQYKHIVDWCGCSPNDFKPHDFDRILSMREKPIFFARKYEAIVNQEIINDVDAYLYGSYPTDLAGLTSYWQNEFHHLDSKSAVSDAHLTFYHSFIRLTLADLHHGATQCQFRVVKLREVALFNEADHFHGLLVLFDAELVSTGKVYTLETHMHPVHLYKIIKPSGPIGRLENLEVGEGFDPKELLFRNFGGLLGPYSEVALKHTWGRGDPYTLSMAWVDPAQTVAASYDIEISQGAHVGHQKPDLIKPLRPGVWSVKVMYKWEVVAETKFLVTPLTINEGRPISAIEAVMCHSGPNGHYAGRDFSDFKTVLKLQDVENMQRKAADNSRKAGKDLEQWVDRLSAEYWRIQATCAEDGVVDTCPYMDHCKYTSWSSRSPDPKSELSSIKTLTGRMR